MKFGSREICDVVFKAADNMTIGNNTFKKYQPVFMIDTARTSTIEQATSTVYAQGGKGYNRLISWEGEKTVTYTVEDALMSPQGLAVLTGAGIAEASETALQHVHSVMNFAIDSSSGKGSVSLQDLKDELGITDSTVTALKICVDIPVYGTILDGSGAGIGYLDSQDIVITGATTAAADDYLVVVDATHPFEVTIADAKGKTVAVDFYIAMSSGVTEITIRPENFGGYFYVEGDTLYRREDTGKDMAATITFPKVKVQSAFTLSMNASGDPSTFSFVMDAMPGYTMFDRTKKTVCNIQIVGTDGETTETAPHSDISPSTHEAEEEGEG